ncbi:hypothetical protein RYX36_011082 [Vicia faba]
MGGSYVVSADDWEFASPSNNVKTLVLFGQTSNGKSATGINQVPNEELHIWLAAQREVARYKGILSPVGPRERLLRRFLSWIGLIPIKSETPFQVGNDGDSPEPYLSNSGIAKPKQCSIDMYSIST